MKLLATSQLRAADQYTIAHEPISSIALMERAAMRLNAKLKEIFTSIHTYYIFCGTGNNGGDGLVMGHLLRERGDPVKIFLLDSGGRI